MNQQASRSEYPSGLTEKHNQLDRNGSPIFDSEKGVQLDPSQPSYGRSKVSHDSRLPNPGGRICDVLPHLRAAAYDDSDGSSDILLKQIEAESGNALQYRTCGWKRVRSTES